jgi:hypothetical protein
MKKKKKFIELIYTGFFAGSFFMLPINRADFSHSFKEF